jgi:hypothetical protein
MHARSAVNDMTVGKDYVYRISGNTNTLVMCSLDRMRADFEKGEHFTGCKGNGVVKCTFLEIILCCIYSLPK